MYKAVIFDFFGVFCPDITLEWFKKAVPDYKARLPELQALCTKSDYGTLDKAGFYTEISKLAQIPAGEVAAGIESEVAINTPLVSYVKDMKRAGYMTACLSNGTAEWALDVINRHGLFELFDEITLSGNLGIVKPDPKIYLYILNKLGVSANEALFVDDREANVMAAEKCGITSILFTNTADFIRTFERLASPA